MFFDAAVSGEPNASIQFTGPSRTQLQLLLSSQKSVDQFWHQDNARRGITVLVPMVDVSTVLGPTELLPGTHMLTEAVGDSGMVQLLMEAKLKWPIVKEFVEAIGGAHAP